ncbi:MAG: prephenate dehydrogenase [Nitrospirae bacterium]|nr:prephenate dehydrogenase [Nitrospirota bacterium]MBF0542032.1 prephenate dehydrogenase [Nitrospirota bacterium]
MSFKHTVIIGVGAIGASFAHSIKRLGLSERVSGYGRTENVLIKAKDRGIIDDYGLNIKELCQDADLVVLTSPIVTFIDIVKSFAGYLKKGAIVTDAGSVKGSLVYDIEEIMPEGIHFVGVHPMAGTEQSGIDASKPSLFEGATVIITPTENTNIDALNMIKELWTKIGAKIKILTPEQHDEIISSISHLPHVIAYTLVNAVFDIGIDNMNYCSNGFLDTTRIAMSSPQMWKDIFLCNKDNILKHIEVFQKNLDTLKNCLENENTEQLLQNLTHAQKLRKDLYKGVKGIS